MVESLTLLMEHLQTLKPGTRFQVMHVVQMQISSVAARVLKEHAQCVSGRSARVIQMERSRCHDNVNKLVEKYDWENWFGFALSDDGIWRVHSWARNKRGRIVETTMRRTHYYGLNMRSDD